jgi:hypothetical protein
MTVRETTPAERRSQPERLCTICLQGVYVTRLETDAESGPGMLHRFGLTNVGDVTWHVEACDHCGHVQVFRRDWRERPDR